MNPKNRHSIPSRLRPTPIALALSLAFGGLAQPALALPAPSAAAVLSAAAPARNIVFIDGQLPDWSALAGAVRPGAQVVRLDPKQNEMDQIARALQGRRDLGSVVLLSHGASGRLQLGDAMIDAAGLKRYGADLRVIKQVLGPNGAILLYGCDVGAGAAGKNFIETLAHDTGAVVAASTDLTGAHGDWNLEISTGTVAAAPVLDTSALAGYHYDLVTITVTNGSDSGSGSLRNAISNAAAGDTIDFSGVSTVTLSSGALSIGKNLTIDGGSGVTIDANYTSGVFSITGGNVTLKNLTITHGVVSGAGGNGGWPTGSSNGPGYTDQTPSAGVSSYGGGIHNAGNLTLYGVTVTANAATGGGGGGGISNSNGGGGGGGSGATSIGGASGGNTSHYAGTSGSNGTGGNGGGFIKSGHHEGGYGGSASGGGAGSNYTGSSYGNYAAGGAGATATAGGLTVGGGGGGAGYDTNGLNGGSAAGGIYNSGTIYIIGTSAITNNLGAGGGGGGGGGVGNHGGYGGRGVGAIWNAATGYVHITATNYTAMGTGNSGVSGTIGGVTNSASNTGFSSPTAYAKIYNAGTAAHLDTSYVPPPTLSLASDTGTSNTDGITSIGTVNVSGLEAGATWQFSTDSGTTWSAGTGSSFTLTGDGAYSVIVKQTVAGNTSSNSTALNFTLDTTPPSATFSSTIATNGGLTPTISSGGTTKDNTLGLSGTVSDTNPLSVQIYDGSTLLGSATVSGSNWSYTTSAFADGTHSFTAKATDKAGNTTTTSPAVTATVDTQAPAAPTLSLANDTGTPGDKITSDGTVNVSGLETNATWQYSTDGGITWTTGTNSSFTLTGDGSKSVIVNQTDLAGNTSSNSAAFTFTLDKTPPSAPTTAIALTAASDTGSSNSDGITNDTSPTMRVSLSGTGAVAGDSVELLLGGASLTHATKATLTSTDITNNYVDLTVTAGDLGTDGPKTFTAQVTDVAGNVGTAGGSYTMTLDTTLPTATTSPSDLTSPSASTFTIQVNYNGSGSGIDSSSIGAGNVSITGPGTIGALTVTGASYSGGTATYTVQAPHSGVWNSTTDAGTYTVAINGGTNAVKDVAGNALAANASASTFTVTYAPTTVVSTAALSADTGASSTDFITNTAAQTVSGTLSANLITGESVQVSYDGGTTWNNATVYTVGSSSWLDTTTLSGSNTFEARVTNSNGSSTAYTHTYTLDITAPTVSNLAGDVLAYPAGSGVLVIDQGIPAAVTEAGGLNGGTLAVSVASGGVSAEDLLGIRNQGGGAGQIGVSGANVSYQGTLIGTYSGGSGGTDLTVNFNANASAVAVGALLDNITYQDIAGASATTGGRTVRFNLSDTAGNVSSNADTAVDVTQVSYTGPVPGGGTATATVTGGGTGCGFTKSKFIPLTGDPDSPPSVPPGGYDFRHGLFDFTLQSCTAGASVTVSIDYGVTLATNIEYWKYGPTPTPSTNPILDPTPGAMPHWYQIPVTVSGTTLSFTITDGSLGDDDVSANGTIADAGGPATPPAAPVPALGGWSERLLAGLLAVFGLAFLRRGRRRSA